MPPLAEREDRRWCLHWFAREGRKRKQMEWGQERMRMERLRERGQMEW